MRHGIVLTGEVRCRHYRLTEICQIGTNTDTGFWKIMRIPIHWRREKRVSSEHIFFGFVHQHGSSLQESA